MNLTKQTLILNLVKKVPCQQFNIYFLTLIFNLRYRLITVPKEDGSLDWLNILVFRCPLKLFKSQFHVTMVNELETGLKVNL